MDSIQVKKTPSTGLIVGIIIAVVVIIIIIALLIWLFSSKNNTYVVPLTTQAQPAVVQPVVVQAQPQPLVAASRRQVAPSNTVGQSRKREGSTFRQILGQQK